MKHYVLDGRVMTPHFPGLGRYARALAQALPPLLKADEALHVLVTPETAPRPPESLPLRGTPFSLSQQWEVPRTLRALQAEVYHSLYLLMPYRPGVPTVLSVNDLIPLTRPAESTLRARLFFDLSLALALRTARLVVTLSEQTRRDLLARFAYPAERVHVVPLAAEERFRPVATEAILSLREKYALPDRFILYVGSNKPHKNLVGLIRAWSLVQTDALLVIAGAWDPRYPQARVEAALHHLEARVRWLGPVAEADLPALYAAATGFVFPSLYEGFGLPPLEAMACGTPVVCSNAASLPEVVGEAGLLCAAHDPAALAEALQRLLDDAALRASLRERGLARAQQFSWTHTAQLTLELYRQLDL